MCHVHFHQGGLLQLCKHADFHGFLTLSLLQYRHDTEGIHPRHVLEAIFFPMVQEPLVAQGLLIILTP